MNLKKFVAGLTALVCCAGAVAYMPEISWKTSAAEMVKNDFEISYEGWYGNTDNVVLNAENGAGNANSRGMTITGRTAPTDGVSSSKGFYLSGGVKYDYSVYVYSETDETFRLSLLCKDMDTDEETMSELVSEEVKGGVWTKLSAKYTAPENSYEFKLTLNTDSNNDFSFDDVLITTKEKQNSVYAAPAGKGLKDEFANYFRVGNILNGGTVKNSTITASYLKDFNAIECENETKPDATLVQNDSTNTNVKVSLNSCAAIADFCVKNNMAFRGHTFVWHSQTPVWFFKEGFNSSGAWVNSTTMDQRLESYIKNMFEAFKTQYPNLNLYAYDVCNECISDNESRTKNNGGAREPGDNNTEDGKSGWVQVYGSNAFVEKAFTFARTYAPEGCKLYYNDYNEYWDHKRDCIINTILKPLYKKGVLDGMGMQSHVPANATGFAGTDSYLQAMDMFLDIGCDVQVSELDISVESGKYSLQDQANKYKAIFQHAMDVNKSGKYNGKVTLLQVWGPNDANSWLKAGSNALLYDSNHQPKLAYTTLMGMLPDSEWGDGSSPSVDDDKPVEPNDYGWYFQHGFESDECGWVSRGGATFETSSDEHYTEWGSKSLLISGRKDSWNSAQYTISPKAFKAGETYSFSVHVKYNSGAETEKFKFTMEYTGSDGETHWDEIASSSAVKGKWVQLANNQYKIPEGASNMKIYVESIDSTVDFYIDEVIGAVGGVSIAGEGAMKDFVRGDLNSDGIINVFDLCMAKRGLIKGFNNSAEELAADVDQSGKVEVADIILLQKYIVKKITEFPVAEKVIDTAAMEAIFSGMKYTSSTKKETDNNPLYSQRYGADPGVMEYNGRVYVYTTNDIYEYDSNGNIGENTFSKITQLNCLSSDDMVNWIDHGIINVAGSNGVAKWANNSWAPCCAHKKINGKEKFFLYFCNNASSLGVLTSDSPTGPWKDELGKAIVTKSTPNCSDVAWLFDPAVMVDDDGTGYLVFGGGNPNNEWAHPKTARVAKLSDDMLSVVGTPATIDAPYLFEDGGINKIGNKYYYTYCSNFNTDGNNYGLNGAAIQYMVSDNPLGPYTYAGQMFRSPGDYIGGEYGANWGNNHHSIVTFGGVNYLFYHARTIKNALGIQGDYRSPQVDKITVNGDKLSVTGTMTGVSQLKTLNPYSKVQAETMSNQGGINVSGQGDTVVTDVDKGDWIKVSGVNFSKGASKVTVKASSKNGSVIKVCTGSPDGKAVAYVEIPSGGSMSEITVPTVNTVNGSQNIYFVFSGQAELDYWMFS